MSEAGVTQSRTAGLCVADTGALLRRACTAHVPSLNPIHTSVQGQVAQQLHTTHYTHHQVSLMVSRNTTLVPSLGLRIGPACEAGLSAGIQRERVPPQKRKKERYNHVTCLPGP